MTFCDLAGLISGGTLGRFGGGRACVPRISAFISAGSINRCFSLNGDRSVVVGGPSAGFSIGFCDSSVLSGGSRGGVGGGRGRVRPEDLELYVLGCHVRLLPLGQRCEDSCERD